MNKMKNHHDLYLKADVLLLACVFETLTSINSFKSDPAHYLYEKVPIYIESTIRGVISVIWKGYAGANNRFLKSYNAKKHTSYIVY